MYSDRHFMCNIRFSQCVSVLVIFLNLVAVPRQWPHLRLKRFSESVALDILDSETIGILDLEVRTVNFLVSRCEMVS